MGDREQARKLFERAYQCQRDGELDDAIRLYQASIAKSPSAEAHTFLGWVLSMQGRYHEAIAECKRAIAVDPTLGNAYNDIGAYLIELGRWDDAIPWLRRAMRAERYEARHYPHVNLARVYEAQGKLLEALAELTRAVERKPGDVPIIMALRKLQARLN